MVVGSQYIVVIDLQYLTLTRLGIAYFVHLVSQFMHAPHPTYLVVIMRPFATR